MGVLLLGRGWAGGEPEQAEARGGHPICGAAASALGGSLAAFEPTEADLLGSHSTPAVPSGGGRGCCTARAAASRGAGEVPAARPAPLGPPPRVALLLMLPLSRLLPQGYGYTTPLSDAGKAFCIFYALLGVPFTMLLLTATVQRLVGVLTAGPVEYLALKWGYTRRTLSCGHLLLLAAVVLVAFFLVPAAVFSALEESWSYLDAFYFCFISLCTIGLGDYVPGEQPGQRLRPLYKISVTGEHCCTGGGGGEGCPGSRGPVQAGPINCHRIEAALPQGHRPSSEWLLPPS